MTLKTAKLLASAIGYTLTYKGEALEYRVNVKQGIEATAYYTNDIFDAVCTACSMHRSRLLIENPRETDAIHAGHVTEAPYVFYLTVGTRPDNAHLVSLWDDPYSRERGKDDGDRLVDLELTSAQRTQLFGN